MLHKAFSATAGCRGRGWSWCQNPVWGRAAEPSASRPPQVGDEDYRVRLIKQQIEDQEKGLELARQWLAKADAKAKAKEQAKEQRNERNIFFDSEI